MANHLYLLEPVIEEKDNRKYEHQQKPCRTREFTF